MSENRTMTPPPPLKKPPGHRPPSSGAPAPPPRRQPLPPTFRHAGKPQPRRHHRRRRLCCHVTVAALAVILILAAAAALSYLYFQPRLPLFRLQSLKSPRLAVAPNSGSPQLSTAVSVKLFASNPSPKTAIAFSPSVAAVVIAIGGDSDDVAVGEAGIGGFELGAGNWTVVGFRVEGRHVAVDDVVGSRMRREWRSKRIRFRVEVGVRVGFGFDGKWSGKVPVRVVCGPVSLRRGMRGDELIKCPIYLFKWIKLH